MHKILVSLPNELYARIRTAVPERKRSEFFTRLIEAEFAKQEEALYQAALVLEQNDSARREVKEWDEAFGNDGLENDVWDPEQGSAKAK
jgi:hypothetical protein